MFILVLAFGGCEYVVGRWRILPKFVVSSPVLPLPVEFVAGGEGRPELFDAAPGLGGGSGKSGKLLARTQNPRKLRTKGGTCLKQKNDEQSLEKKSRQPGRAQVIKKRVFYGETKGRSAQERGNELVVEHSEQKRNDTMVLAAPQIPFRDSKRPTKSSGLLPRTKTPPQLWCKKNFKASTKMTFSQCITLVLASCIMGRSYA